MRAAFLALCLLLADCVSAQPIFSVVFEHAIVVDGTGGPAFTADVGISGDRIAAVGQLQAFRALHRVDATGLVLAPGFIDIHSHAVGESNGGALGARPDAPNLIRQGVTSVLSGQDGSSPWPIADALAHFEVFPPAVNVGLFVGQGTLREHVLGPGSARADSTALEAMADMVRQAMTEGSFGLSSGLEYTPGMFADAKEITYLARASAPWGGLYISHVRDEGAGLMDSVEELISIAEGAGVPGQLTHHKVIGKDRWGATATSLARVNQARDDGQDITLDVYPYTASSTGMTILFPAWAKDGGLTALQSRLQDPETRVRIRKEVIAHIESERGGDPESIVAASCGFDASLAGKSLGEMARRVGLEPTVPNAADVAIDLVLNGSCQGVFHSMSEDDVIRVLRSPHAMVASDGGVPAQGVGAPHPRSYGTFARVLSRYVRALGALTLEEAIHKMTGAPARRLGLPDRGVIRPGNVADLAVFRLDDVEDRATFENPHQLASGMQFVLVGGVAVLWQGSATGARPGRVLRKGAP